MARKMMALMGVFGELAPAERGIAALEALGVPAEEISVLAHHASVPWNDEQRDANGSLVIPASLTLTLVGIVLLAIPLAGLLTAGPLAVLGGVGSLSRAGGPVDQLVDLGVDRADAKLAHEHLRRGGIIVVAVCERALARRAAEALDRAGALDFRGDADEWEARGWEYEPNAPMWPVEQVLTARRGMPTERAMRRSLSSSPASP